MAVATMAGCQKMPVMQQMQPAHQMQTMHQMQQMQQMHQMHQMHQMQRPVPAHAMMQQMQQVQQMPPQPMQAMMQQVPGGPMQPVMLIPVPFQPGAPGAQGLAGPASGAPPCRMASAPVSPATSISATPVASPVPSRPLTPAASHVPSCPPNSAPSTPRSPESDGERLPTLLARQATPKRKLTEGMQGVSLQALEAGGKERQRALEAMRGSVRKLSFDEAGCRLVQRALELGDRAAAPLARELRGSVEQACKSKHANFVVQKIVEVMLPSQCAFIAEELRGAASSVARNCYGCRVLCRLAEHDTPLVAELAEELLPAADKLCRHQYAHYVIESILEHGSPDHRRRVSEAVMAECAANARHKHAGHIVEKALIHCEPEDVRALAEVLVPPTAEARRRLAKDRCGRHVVMALLKVARLPEHRQGLISASVEAEFSAVLSKSPCE